MAASEADHDISVEEVTGWLSRHSYGMAALELYEDMARQNGGRGYAPLLRVAESVLDALQVRDARISSSLVEENRVRIPESALPLPTTSDAQGNATSETNAGVMKRALVAALRSYRDVAGVDSLRDALREVDCSISDVSIVTDRTPLRVASSCCTAVQTESVNLSPHETLQVSIQQLEAELQSVRAQLQERERSLQATVATVTSSLPVLTTATGSMRKEGLLPLLRLTATLGINSTSRASARHTLLGLHRCPSREQRTLIVHEWMNVARTAPKRCLELEMIPELYSLVNARAPERRLLALQCATTVAPLLEPSSKIRYALFQGLLRPLGDDESSTVRREVPASLSILCFPVAGEDAGGDVVSPFVGTVLTSSATSPRIPPMELIIRLAMDSYSTSVRRAAIKELRETIMPRCQQSNELLSTLVPLFMTFMSMEVDCLRVEHGRRGRGGGTSLRRSQDLHHSIDTVDEKTSRSGLRCSGSASLLTSLAMTNLRTLINLASLAFECVTEHVRSIGEGPHFSTAQSLLREEYVQVVLPTAYSLVSEVSTNMANYEHVIELLCQLAVALASLVPLMSLHTWTDVRTSLYFFLKGEQTTRLCETDSVAHAPPEGDACAARLLFFFAFLVRLAGEQIAFVSCDTPASDAADEIGRGSASFLIETALDSESEQESRLDVLARCFAELSSYLVSKQRLAAGVMAVLWALATSDVVIRRLLAIDLITRACARISDDVVSTTFVSPMLLVLINDETDSVREGAVRASIVVAASLSDAVAQEKVLCPALGVVEASDCMSDLNVAMLQQWTSLMRVMPAEPRETFLYPQLSLLMEQLLLHPPPPTRPGRPTLVTAADALPAQALTTGEAQAWEQWERVMFALQATLQEIPKCAVVTPSLITRDIVPGIRRLGSEKALQLASPALRSRWALTVKAYDELMESNRTAAPVAATTNLLVRVRDAWKRHL